jgi:hypothetical protein
VFLIRNKIYRGAPRVSFSLSPRRACSSARCLHLACHVPCRADTAARARAIKRRLAAVSAIRSRATSAVRSRAATSLSERLPTARVRAPPSPLSERASLPSRAPPPSPRHRVLLRSRLPPLITLSPSLQELAAGSRPIAGTSTASIVVTHSMVSGAPSTPLPPFSLGTPAPELPLPSHPDAGPRRPPEHPPHRRTPSPSRFFRPSRRQEARVSCRLHPLVWRVTPPSWMLEHPPRPTSATVAPLAAVPLRAPGAR